MYQGVSTSFFKKRNNRGNSFVVNNSTKDDISLIYDVQEWSINCQGVVRGLIRKIVSHSLFLTESRNNFRNIFFSHWFPREQEIRLPNNRQKTHLLQSEAFEKATKTTKKKREQSGMKQTEMNEACRNSIRRPKKHEMEPPTVIDCVTVLHRPGFLLSRMVESAIWWWNIITSSTDNNSPFSY